MGVRDEVFERHCQAFEDIALMANVAASAKLAQYVLRNALFDLEMAMQHSPAPAASMGRMLQGLDAPVALYAEAEVSSEEGKVSGPAPQQRRPGRWTNPLPKESLDWRDEERTGRLALELRLTVSQLALGEITWRSLEREIRLSILQWVVKELSPDRMPSMREFEGRQPHWMPSASALALTPLNGRWNTMVDWWAG